MLTRYITRHPRGHGVSQQALSRHRACREASFFCPEESRAGVEQLAPMVEAMRVGI